MQGSVVASAAMSSGVLGLVCILDEGLRYGV